MAVKSVVLSAAWLVDEWADRWADEMVDQSVVALVGEMVDQ